MGDRPSVVVIGGNDPTGGAGLGADVEALAGQGCRACPVVTAVTVQTSVAVQGFEAVEPGLVTAQLRALLGDLSIAAVKIGMLANAENARAVAAVLRDHPDLPVVLDPVLRGGGGGALARSGLAEAILDLLPLTDLTTPNRGEARRLAGGPGRIEDLAANLLRHRCRGVLITGADEGEGPIVHRLFTAEGPTYTLIRPRLTGGYHGSGCTLASAIAGGLARGRNLFTAVRAGQDYTEGALRHALRPGRGQSLPNRMYWADDCLPTTH